MDLPKQPNYESTVSDSQAEVTRKRHEQRREKHDRPEARVSATPRQKRSLAVKVCSVLQVSLIYVTKHPVKP